MWTCIWRGFKGLGSWRRGMRVSFRASSVKLDAKVHGLSRINRRTLDSLEFCILVF